MSISSPQSLGGIEYNVIEREGSVIFTEANPIFSTGTRIVFYRGVNKGGWRLKLSGDSDTVFMPMVVKAYRLVVAEYGDGYDSRST